MKAHQCIPLLAAAALALPAITRGQDEPKAPLGWTRAFAPDGKSWDWTLKDSEQKGFALVFHCEDDQVELRSTESLVQTADYDDMKVTVTGLSLHDKRMSVSGFLSGDLHGVRFDGEANDELRSWLHWDGANDKLTFFVSGGGQRLILAFNNRSLVLGDDLFDCEMPKAKK